MGNNLNTNKDRMDIFTCWNTTQQWKKEHTATLCHNMDEFLRHDVQQKPDTKQYIMYDSIYKKFQNFIEIKEMKVRIEVCFWGSVSVLTGRGQEEDLCVLIMGYVLTWMVFTQVYIKLQRAIHLWSVCFTICMLYFNEKIKRKRVAWKGARGGIWNNIWAVIPRVPKPMGKAVSPYFVSYLMVYR